MPPSLATLRSITPTLQNTSASKDPKPMPIISAFKPSGGFVRYFFRIIGNCFSFVAEKVWSNATIVEPGQSELKHSSEDAGSQSAEEEEYLNRYSAIDRHRLKITQAEWDRLMLHSIEPQHVSLRTTMLRAVGFPVDHLAMLWCSQVLKEVLRIMQKLDSLGSAHLPPSAARRRLSVPLRSLQPPLSSLSHNESAGSDDPTIWLSVPVDPGAEDRELTGIALEYTVLEPGLLPLDSKALPKYPKSAHHVIPPLAAALRRNATQSIWKHAETNERKKMAAAFDSAPVVSKDSSLVGNIVRRLKVGWFVTISVIFVSQKLQSIALCYVVIGALCFLVPILKRMTLSPVEQEKSFLQFWIHILHPSTHLQLRTLKIAAAALLGKGWWNRIRFVFGKFPFNDHKSKDDFVFLNIFLNAIIVFIAFCVSGYFDLSSPRTFKILGPVVEWTASYSLALWLWLLTGMIVFAARLTVDYTITAMFKAIRQLISTFKKTPLSSDQPIDEIKKARAAKREARIVQTASMLQYLSGYEGEEGFPMYRPSALKLVVAFVSPILSGTAVAYMVASSQMIVSPTMFALCCSILVVYPTMVLFWLLALIVPTPNTHAPQWVRPNRPASLRFDQEDETDKVLKPLVSRHGKEKSSHVLAMGIAVTWPIIVLGLPSFDYALSVYSGGVTVKSVVQTVVLRVVHFLITRFGISVPPYTIMTTLGIEFVNGQLQASSATATYSVPELKDLLDIFGPGLIYTNICVYLCVIFLIILRR